MVTVEPAAVPGRLVSLLRRIRDRFRRWYYRLHRKLPVDPDLVVLAVDGYRSFGGGPWAIQQELERVAPGRFRCVWFAKGAARETMPPDVDVVVPDSLRYHRTIARAGTVIQQGHLPRPVAKRPGQTFVQIASATPIAREGLDLTEFPVAARRTNFAQILDDCDRWDLVLTPNQHTSEVWERAYPAPYDILETGSPESDAYHRSPDIERHEAREHLGVRPEETLVLYAPVARDHLRPEDPPVPLTAVAGALPEGHILAVYPPQDADDDAWLRSAAGDRRIRDAGRLPREGACLAADVLITDYSPIMVDVAGLDRPIVLFLPEDDTFQVVRGTYFDLEEHGPGPVASDVEDLRRLLGDGTYRSVEYDQRRRRFRDRFCSLNDGEASRRAALRIFGLSGRALDEDSGATGERPTTG